MKEIKLLYNTVEVPILNGLARTFSKNRLFYSVVLVGLIGMVFLLTIFLCYYAKRLFIQNID